MDLTATILLRERDRGGGCGGGGAGVGGGGCGDMCCVYDRCDGCVMCLGGRVVGDGIPSSHSYSTLSGMC